MAKQEERKQKNTERKLVRERGKLGRGELVKKIGGNWGKVRV